MNILKRTKDCTCTTQTGEYYVKSKYSWKKGLRYTIWMKSTCDNCGKEFKSKIKSNLTQWQLERFYLGLHTSTNKRIHYENCDY